jgi:hypothetical protein
LDTVGIPPPLTDRGGPQFHYPIAGAISPDARFLYVVNSDFNLEFSGAHVHVVHLDGVRQAIAAQQRATDPVLNESQFIGRNGFDTAALPEPSQGSTVRINPFATGAALRPLDATGNRSRLYITVRGDGTLSWIDTTADGADLLCGQQARGELCDEIHRPGHDPERNPRGLVMPPLPTSLHAGNDGFVTVTHQEFPRARVSLFYDPGANGPALVHWVADLSPNLSALLRVNEPPRGSTTSEQPHWYALSRFEPFVNHVRGVADADRSFLFLSHATQLEGVASDVGIRGIARDPCDPNRAFATARPRPADTVGGLTRSGDQLLALDLTDAENPRVIDVLGLPPGPSNLLAIPYGGHCSEGTRVYVVMFDARKIYVVDPKDWQEVAQVRTQAGPHTLLADPLLATGDPAHQLLYLLDFSAMVVEVIDVNPASPSYNTVVYRIGDVVRPQETR